MTDTSGGDTPRGPDQRELRRSLARTRIGPDLLARMAGRPDRFAAKAEPDPNESFPVIIEANAGFPGGGGAARLAIARAYVWDREIKEAGVIGRLRARGFDLADVPQIARVGFGTGDRIDLDNSFWTNHHLIGTLTRATILRLANWAPESSIEVSPVYKLWLNHTLHGSIFESVRTVKCDAARAAFFASGEDVVWAVCDTGIDGAHPHFATHNTLVLANGLDHHDFTGPPAPAGALNAALVDDDGHGTHVAGVIAGETNAAVPGRVRVAQEVRISDTQTQSRVDDSRASISGLAPKCKLVSLKVLPDRNLGNVGLLMSAIGYIQTANSHGGDLKIHGVNMSLGYSFDATWFAAGRSPLCVEIDRLVKSGVVVVIAAGNSGYGTVQNLDGKAEQAAHLGSINDPGNAELAITVGSTHRDSPHTFGISYFSGKGPTADGRQKPDLVAPGERIVSCAPMTALSDTDRPFLAAGAGQPGDAPFVEESGTSMAAPHVSGAIAAFLSVRREFRGQPEKVKRIFLDSATDLGRRPDFQGAGLIDTMRALQLV